jgi:hypothetical protein
MSPLSPISLVKMMKHQTQSKYAKRARKLFCKGTCFTVPVDLVLSGKRTLEEWTTVLAQERDLAEQSSVSKTIQANKQLT